MVALAPARQGLPGRAAVVLVAALVLGFALGGSQFGGQAGSASTAAPPKAQLERAYGKLPLRFEANRGQTDSQVKFLSRGAGYSFFLTPKEAVLSLQRPAAEGPSDKKAGSGGEARRAVVRMRMLGANPSPQLAGVGRLPGESNYLVGNDRSKWRTGVESYGRVRYRSVYPGTDLVYYGRQGRLEYDFVLRPGADPDRIGLSFAGAEGMRVDRHGDLVLSTAAGEVRQRRPVVYQQHGDQRQRVAGRYVLGGKRRVGFALGPYDRAKSLVIDPVLEYSTYLGGSGSDGIPGDGTGIAVDGAGSAYVTGATSSVDFPTKNAIQPANRGGSVGGSTDIFVAKVNPAGSALEYSTYLGGSEGDGGSGNDIAVDGTGSAYVTGDTYSTDFPTTQGAFQRAAPGNRDGFVAKLNPAGSGLVYSSYLGGVQSGDIARGIAVDGAGSAYVTGDSQGTADFPTTARAFQKTNNTGAPIFVTKFTPDGSALDYSTYIAGRDGETSFDIAVDSANSAYVTGRTASVNFPTTENGFQREKLTPGLDVFVTRLNAEGSALVYSTYLNGASSEAGVAIAVDDKGAAYVAGFTLATSPDFPTKNAFDSIPGGGSDGFVAKFDTTARSGEASLVYSTYLGGSGDDVGPNVRHVDIAVDSAGSAYVAGRTNSPDFPTKDALDSTLSGRSDVFVTKFSPAGAELVYSTYLGGDAEDTGLGIAIDSTGSAYLTGFTLSSNFPTRGSFQAANAGGSDAFVTKLSTPVPALPAVSVGDAAVTEGDAGESDATFTVSLSEPSSRPVSVDFATADDSAKAPDDYVQRSGTVNFAPGEVNKTVTVAVRGDTLDEADERFIVNLSNPQGAVVGDGQGIGTIRDDDPRPSGAPAVSIADVAVTEGDTGQSDAAFAVSLSHASDSPVSIDFASADDTAIAPGDYMQKRGTVTFAGGEVNKTVTVPVNGDRFNEVDERFLVNLSNPRGATVADGQGVGTIRDDDLSAPGPSTGDDSSRQPNDQAGPGPGAGSGRRCLAKRSAIGQRNIGRIRVGTTARGLLRSAVKPLRRQRRLFRYCVKGSRGFVGAVFDSRRRTILVFTTARGHGNRGVRPGTSVRKLRRAYGKRRRIGRGLFRPRRASYPLIGTRDGKVRYLATASPRLRRNPDLLRTFLRRAGL